jgi:hypothetical protein
MGLSRGHWLCMKRVLKLVSWSLPQIYVSKTCMFYNYRHLGMPFYG